jgi:YD repeat-containing protein
LRARTAPIAAAPLLLGAAVLLFGAAAYASTPIPGGTAPASATTVPAQAPRPERLYQDLGPAITHVYLSAPYPDGGRVLWACGWSVVVKIDAGTFDVIATLRRPGAPSDDTGRREGLIASFDAHSEVPDQFALAPGAFGVRAPAGSAMGTPPLSVAPTAPVLDADGRLLVPEDRAIVAYGDVEPGVRLSGIRVAQRFEMPASIPGRFTGLFVLADGHVAAATDAGWVVVLARGFSRLATARLENASASNRVRGPLVADDRGGLFVASERHLHRVAWDGSDLSTDPKDGAWSEPLAVPGGLPAGSIPVLLEAGADRLVAVITATAPSTLLVMWRDAIPEGWRAAEPGRSPRIAALRWMTAPATAHDGMRGWGRGPARAALPSLAATGAGLLVSTDGPDGPERLTWDAQARVLTPAWTSAAAPAPMGGVVFSQGAQHVYYVGRHDGRPTLVGLDWASGAVALDRPLDGARFSAQWAVPLLDPAGRYVSGCMFGVMRLGLEP